MGLEIGCTGAFVKQGLSTEFIGNTCGDLCVHDTQPPNNFPVTCVEECYVLIFLTVFTFQVLHVVASNIHTHAHTHTHKVFANICGDTKYANCSHNKFFIISPETETDFCKTFVKW